MRWIQLSDNIKNENIALCAILTTVALVFSYIESLIPIPIPVYGVKLGIANIAVITVLYTVGDKEALAVNVLRIIINAALFGNINSFIFSMSGGLLSIIIMIIFKKINIFSIIGVSIAGGVTHNIGQIIAAVFIMNTSVIIYYLPVLIVAGVVTGIVIGVVGYIITIRIKKALT